MSKRTCSTPTETPKRRSRWAAAILLAIFVFALVIDNGFKFVSVSIAEDLHLSTTTVSLQATLTGVLIGLGAVVYAALADFVSIRKLLIVAIVLVAVGSVLGFVGQAHFITVIAGRLIQTAGIAAAETLYVIYVTKNYTGNAQKRYLGYSTAAFQLSLLLGAVGGGFIATYVSWTWLFIVALIPLAAIPIVVRTVPAQHAEKTAFDALGLFLIAVIATALLLFMQAFAWWYLLPVAAAAGAFAWHVARGRSTLIDRAFLSDGQFLLTLAPVFILYSVQLGYSFLFPFLVTAVFDVNLSIVSLLLVPGFICAILVGVFTGAIARKLPTRRAIITGTSAIAVSLIGPAFLINTWIGVFVISMVVFSSGFALIYAPLLQTAIGNLPQEKTGVAIGVYNLSLNIAVPLGIAYTARLLESRLTVLDPLLGHGNGSFASVLLILGLVAVIALGIYLRLPAPRAHPRKADATNEPAGKQPAHSEAA